MDPADNRARTIVFVSIVVATTAIVIVGMLTHTITEGLIVALVSTPIASILSFMTGRATAPPLETPQPPHRRQTFIGPTPQDGLRGEPSPSSPTALAAHVRLWWHRRRRPPTRFA